MYRIILSWGLGVALTLTQPTAFVSAAATRNQNPTDVQVKQTIKDLGEGYQSRVNVELKDGTKIEGYLSTVADDYFAVTSPKTGKTIKIAYGDVAKVNKVKPSRSGSGRPIAAIIGGIVIVVFAFAVYIISDKKG